MRLLRQLYKIYPVCFFFTIPCNCKLLSFLFYCIIKTTVTVLICKCILDEIWQKRRKIYVKKLKKEHKISKNKYKIKEEKDKGAYRWRLFVSSILIIGFSFLLFWYFSYKDLKVFIFPAPLIFSGNLFHFSATLLMKKFLLTSVLHLVVSIFNASEECLE